MTALPPIDRGVVILSRERLREWAEAVERACPEVGFHRRNPTGWCLWPGHTIAQRMREAANGKSG